MSNKNMNIEYEEQLIEYNDEDFSNELDKEAKLALELQRKDEKNLDGIRIKFDSADYWMKHKDKRNSNSNSNNEENVDAMQID